MLQDEPKDRIRVVGEQYEIENAVAQSEKGAAVFLVPSCVTPLYIPKEDLTNIPDGLISKTILEDPEQLLTVTERVTSINTILEAGMQITVLCVDRNRKKVGSASEVVNDSHVKTLEEKYKNLKIVTIPQEQYDHYKNTACAASYCYSNDHTLKGVNATQVNTPNTPNRWNILEGEAVKPAVAQLDELLRALGLPPLEDMVKNKAIVSSITDAKLATTLGLFTGAANESTAKQPMPSTAYQP
jgi:hypothetical protein